MRRSSLGSPTLTHKVRLALHAVFHILKSDVAAGSAWGSLHEQICTALVSRCEKAVANYCATMRFWQFASNYPALPVEGPSCSSWRDDDAVSPTPGEGSSSS